MGHPVTERGRHSGATLRDQPRYLRRVNVLIRIVSLQFCSFPFLSQQLPTVMPVMRYLPSTAARPLDPVTGVEKPAHRSAEVQPVPMPEVILYPRRCSTGKLCNRVRRYRKACVISSSACMLKPEPFPLAPTASGAGEDMAPRPACQSCNPAKGSPRIRCGEWSCHR